MASGDEVPDSGQRRTGVVRRADLVRSRPSTARRDWLALVGVAALAVVVLAVLSSLFGGQPVVNAGPTSTAGIAAASGTPTLKPTFSPEASATPTPSPTPSPTASPTPIPSRTPTPSPSPSPTPSPTPTPGPTPAPTAPPFGLLILDPIDGSTSADRAIVIRGLTQPGATVTREVPFWFDEHTVADGAGRWSFVESLNPGGNAFNFRVADDASTAVTLTVYYTPN
jgi:hypothetical protein